MFSTRESETIHMFIPTIYLCMACRKFSPSSTGFPSPFPEKGPPIDRKPIRAGTDRDLVAPRARSTYLKCSKTSETERERSSWAHSCVSASLSLVLLTWDFSVQVKLAKTHTNRKLRIPFGYFDGDPTTSENFPWEIDAAGGDRVR